MRQKGDAWKRRENNELLIEHKNKENFSYEIYDALGRKLDSGFALQGTGLTSLNTIDKNMPIFVKINKNGETQVLKLILL